MVSRRLINDMLKRKVYAVVGASRSERKWGRVVYEFLKAHGKRVYAVNPKASDIGGDPCWPTLAALPVKPDVVDIVTPPQVTEQIVRQADALGITRIWMQPGAESPRAIKLCTELGLKCVWDACVMIETKKAEERAKVK